MKPLWTPKQAKALPLLASGMTGVATAQAVGCKASTVSDWLHNNAAFVSELEQLRGQATRQAMDQLQGSLTMAVSELQKLLTTSTTDAIRLKAAMFVIEGMTPMKSLQRKTLDPASELEMNQIHQVFNQLGLVHATQ
jgi:hypothetical protein